MLNVRGGVVSEVATQHILRGRMLADKQHCDFNLCLIVCRPWRSTFNHAWGDVDDWDDFWPKMAAEVDRVCEGDPLHPDDRPPFCWTIAGRQEIYVRLECEQECKRALDDCLLARDQDSHWARRVLRWDLAQETITCADRRRSEQQPKMAI